MFSNYKTLRELLFIVVLLTFFITTRVFWINEKKEPLFDEKYYIYAANSYINGNYLINEEHPPLGKMLIGIGISVLGNNQYGWRVVPLIFGSAGIVMLYILGKLIFKDALTAAFSALLLMSDTMWSYFSGLAMLDILISSMVIGSAIAIWVFINKPTTLSSFAVGILLGAGLSIKWNALLLIGAFIFLVYLKKIYNPELRFEIKYSAVIFITSVAVYYLLYLLILPEFGIVKNTVLQLTMLQVQLFTELKDASATHPWSWFFVSKNGLPPVNPFIYWGWPLIFLLLIYLILKGKLKGNRQNLGFILTCFSFLYLPWFLVARPVYSFYILPAVPFICLTIGFLLRKIWVMGVWGKSSVVVYLAATFFYTQYVFLSYSGLAVRFWRSLQNLV